MSSSGVTPSDRPTESLETHAPAAATADAENQAQPAQGRYGMQGIRRKWKSEDMLKRLSLALRGLALLFSLISFIVMVSNRHGDWKNFVQYEEYRYLTAIAILSTLYSGVQTLRQVRELSTGRSVGSRRNVALVDFIGDQIMAYLLLSSSSTSVPLTNRFRENADNIFTDSSAVAISMSFFAFMALAFSALISGYKLANQSRI